MNFRINSIRLAIVAAVTIAAGVAHAQSIKVAFNGDLSASPSAQSGAAGVLGIKAAIEDINSAGGVLGKKLELVVRDDQSQPPKSIQNMIELIDNEKVSAIFGPTNSGNAMAWRHIPNQKKVVTMGMIATGTDITKPISPKAENYMFRVSITDREQVVALMAYAKKAGAKHIGLISETTGYGQGGLKDMLEVAKTQGVTIAASEKIGVSDSDMTSQLNKMKAANVDLIILWAQGTPIGQVVRSMEKINYFPSLLTSWAADNITFYDAAGKKLAGHPLFMRTMVGAETAKQKALFERLKGKLAAPGSFPFAVHGYDATLLVAAAMRQAGSVEGPKVRAALESLKAPVEGVKKIYTNPFSTANHEALGASDYMFVRWNDGNLASYSDAITKSFTAADFKR